MEKQIDRINELCNKWVESGNNNKVSALVEKAQILDKEGLDKKTQIALLLKEMEELEDHISNMQPSYTETEEEIIKINTIHQRLYELGIDIRAEKPYYKWQYVKKILK